MSEADQPAPPRWSLAEPPPDRNMVRSDGLAGKVAVVTGGASGIGAGVARRLAAGGARVVVADIDEPGARRVAEEIGGVATACDVREPADSAAAVALAEATWGGLDLVHLNAGTVSGTSLDDLDVERYRRTVAVNLDGAVFGIAAALPALRRRGGGTIIVTASVAGLMPMPYEPFYTATKHAVIGLCRSAGLALHGEGIAVRALCPGFTDTPLIAGARERLVDAGLAVLSVADVVDGFLAALDEESPGACLYVVADQPPAPFRFRRWEDEPAGPPDAGEPGDAAEPDERERPAS